MAALRPFNIKNLRVKKDTEKLPIVSKTIEMNDSYHTCRRVLNPQGVEIKRECGTGRYPR